MKNVNLIENRPAVYDALFEGELPYKSQPSIEEIGLSGLWRAHTNKNGRNGGALEAQLSKIPDYVSDVLMAHDKESRSEDYCGGALYSMVDPKSLKDVTDITSRVVATWEKAVWRNGENSPFLDGIDMESHGTAERRAHRQASEALIIVTGAAVVEVMPLYFRNPAKPSKAEKAEISAVLANWGPQFTTEWLNGSIIGDWLEREGIEGDEQSQWLDVFDFATKKRFLRSAIQDPLDALARSKANLDSLTDEAISRRIGCTVDEAKNFFAPGLRKMLAIGYMSDPFVGVNKVNENFKALTDEAIMDRIGCDIETARDVFTPGVRKYFASKYLNDPFAQFSKIKAGLELMNYDSVATYLGWSVDEVKDVFSETALARCVIYSPSNPMSRIDTIVGNMKLLTNESIAEATGWSVERVAVSFTRGDIRQVAEGRPNDPLSVFARTADNMSLLTDEMLSSLTGRSQEDIKQLLTHKNRISIALYRRDDPLEGALRFSDNMYKLTDAAIARGLGWSEDDVREKITYSIRKYHALHNSNDPLEGLVRRFTIGRKFGA